MKEKGIHEGTIEQMYRLFSERLYGPDIVPIDEKGRIRIDDWEMREDVQEEVAKLWDLMSTDNIFDVITSYSIHYTKLYDKICESLTRRNTPVH